MVKVKLSDPGECDGLLDRDAYVWRSCDVSRYTGVTEQDLELMLEAIGVDSVEQLFDAIPAGVRLKQPIDLPPGEPEQAVYAELRRLAERNVSRRGRDVLPRRRDVRPLRARRSSTCSCRARSS